MTGAGKDSGQPKTTPASFPGGNVSPEKGELRIAIDKKAYAEVIGHAVLEPEVEVCGVLVGRLLRDAQGEFLHIRAAIRGEAAKQEGAQVTFTHDTWNHIHQEMDTRYPDEEIVGWYHTHGGFGIFLSEMDTFIHRNFFSAPHQVAYVFDPLAGTEGFFQARGDQLALCRRHWVGGRERRVVARDPAGAPAAAGGSAERSSDFGAVANELHRTALALQAMAQRPADPMPLWAWIGIGLAGALAVWMILGGGISPAGRAPPESRASGTLLLLDRDESGRAVGLELHGVTQQQGPVYRDASGQLFVGVDLLGPDRRPIPLSTLLGQAPGAAPQSTAQPAPALEPAPGWLERLRLPLLVAAGVLALLAAGFFVWRSGKPGVAR